MSHHVPEILTSTLLELTLKLKLKFCFLVKFVKFLFILVVNLILFFLRYQINP